MTLIVDAASDMRPSSECSALWSCETAATLLLSNFIAMFKLKPTSTKHALHDGIAALLWLMVACFLRILFRNGWAEGLSWWRGGGRLDRRPSMRPCAKTGWRYFRGTW